MLVTTIQWWPVSVRCLSCSIYHLTLLGIGYGMALIYFDWTILLTSFLFSSCFPHVVNIAVKTGLQHLTTIVNAAHDKDLEGTDNFLCWPDALLEDCDYAEALQNDVVGAARSLITAVRGSGQCCEEFKQIIKNGNISGGWGDFKQQLRVVELLKDVDTRWSSTFLMIDRLLELWLVRSIINCFIMIDLMSSFKACEGISQPTSWAWKASPERKADRGPSRYSRIFVVCTYGSRAVVSATNSNTFSCSTPLLPVCRHP